MKHLMKILLFKMSLCLCLSTIETVLLAQLMLTAAKTTFPTRIPIGKYCIINCACNAMLTSLSKYFDLNACCFSVLARNESCNKLFTQQ